MTIAQYNKATVILANCTLRWSYYENGTGRSRTIEVWGQEYHNYAALVAEIKRRCPQPEWTGLT
jgi:hypothetical protein